MCRRPNRASAIRLSGWGLCRGAIWMKRNGRARSAARRVCQIVDGDAMAVDEPPVVAAVVQDSRAVAPDGDDGIAAEDLRILQPHVGDQTAPDVGDRALQPDQVGLAVVLERQVTARGAGRLG
jgi:hypothetical protein